MPLVAFTYGCVEDIVCAVVDGQVQRIHTCAAIVVGVLVGVSVGGSVGRAMPLVAFTYGCVDNIVRAVVDGQVQGIHTCTAIVIGILVGVGVGGGVGRTVPLICFTYYSVEYIVCAVVNGQVQRIYTCTTISIGIVISICARCCVCRFMPLIVFAHSGVIHIVGTMVHSQLKCHCAVATVSGSSKVGISRHVRAFIICYSIDPSHAVTGDLHVDTFHTVIHCQVIINSTIASCSQSIGIANETALCIGTVVPYKLVADDSIKSHIIGRIFLHIPNHNAITTRICGQCIGIGTRSSHFVSIEINTTAFTESLIQTGNRCNMLYNLIQIEALLE